MQGTCAFARRNNAVKIQFLSSKFYLSWSVEGGAGRHGCFPLKLDVGGCKCSLCGHYSLHWASWGGSDSQQYAGLVRQRNKPCVGYGIKGRKAGDLELMGRDLATTADLPTGGCSC